jgi:catechol 2,3-dioxygenase-like lactoylglutathione lyase family enzyme
VLGDARAAGRLPAQDLERARRFYPEKLGLDPVDERPGGLLYRPAGGGEFALFQSSGEPSGMHTQMGFEVDDVEAVVAELRSRGVEFDEAGIVDIEGNYPSKSARGERGAWFRDSEGNIIGIGELVS